MAQGGPTITQREYDALVARGFPPERIRAKYTVLPAEKGYSTGGEVVSGLARGATFGASDIGQGLAETVAAKLKGDPRSLKAIYQEKARANAAETDAFREQHGFLAPALEVGGGLATGGAGALRSGAKLAGKGIAARIAGQGVKAGAKRAAQAAGVGALSGAATSVGRGDLDAGNIATSAGLGGAVGGTLAGTLGAAGGFTKWLKRHTLPITPGAAQREGAEEIAGLIEREAAARPLGIEARNVAQRVLTSATPDNPVTLIDEGGAPLLNRAREVAGGGGPGALALRQAHEARNLAEPDRVRRALQEATGASDANLPAQRSAAIASRDARAAVNFPQAFAEAGEITDPVLLKALDEPGIAELYPMAHARAAAVAAKTPGAPPLPPPRVLVPVPKGLDPAVVVKNQRASGRFPMDAEYVPVPAGPLTGATLPDPVMEIPKTLQALHYLKIAADDQVDALARSPQDIKHVDALILKQKLNPLRERAKAIYPAYRNALDDYQQASREVEGLDYGRQAFAKGRPEDVAEQVKTAEAVAGGASAVPEMPADPNAFRRGLAYEARTAVDATPNTTGNAAGRVFGTKADLERIGQAIPDEAKQQTFQQRIAANQRMRDVSGRVGRHAVEGTPVDAPVPPLHVRAMVTSPTGFAAGALSLLTRNARGRARAIEDAMAGQLHDPSQFLQRLSDRERELLIRQSLLGGTQRGIAGAAGMRRDPVSP